MFRAQPITPTDRSWANHATRIQRRGRGILKFARMMVWMPNSRWTRWLFFIGKGTEGDFLDGTLKRSIPRPSKGIKFQAPGLFFGGFFGAQLSHPTGGCRFASCSFRNKTSIFKKTCFRPREHLYSETRHLYSETRHHAWKATRKQDIYIIFQKSHPKPCSSKRSGTTTWWWYWLCFWGWGRGPPKKPIRTGNPGNPSKRVQVNQPKCLFTNNHGDRKSPK